MSILINYIREKSVEDEIYGYKGVPKGVLVALDKNHIGYSLCNPKDRWNKKLGLLIAKNRAEKGIDIENLYDKKGERIIRNLYDHLKFFKEKAQRYFKEK